MKKTSKILSLLLCLSMLLGMLPEITLPAAAADTKTVVDYIVYSNDSAIMFTSTPATTRTQEVAIGGTPMLPTLMMVNIEGTGKYQDVDSFTTTIKDADGKAVQSINTSTAGTYTVTVALPEDYTLKDGVGEPTMIVKVGPTVYENMYAAGTDAKPVPYGDYNVLGQTTWQEDTVNGGLRTTKLMPGNNTQYYQLTISIPNDAYYEVTADLGVTAPAMAEGTSQPTLTIGIVEDTNGRQVFSQNTKCTWIYPSQALDNLGLGDYKTERYEATPGKTSFQTFPYPADNQHSVFGGTLTKKGGDVQFLVGLEYFHNAIDGTAFYGTIKNVKLKRLTNSYNISTAGSGSGTFDVDWKDSSASDKTGVQTSAGTIGRGDTATLTAHAGANSRFAGWYDASGKCVSVDRVFSIVAGASADDTSEYNYTAKFESGEDTLLTNLVDTSNHNTDKAMVADVQTGWSSGSSYVGTTEAAKPLTMRFTTTKDNENVYFDAALSNMDLNCYLDGSETPYTLSGESKTIDYAQADWSAGKADLSTTPQDDATFAFQRSVTIPVAKAGTHTLTFKATKDLLTSAWPNQIYARLSGLGVTSDTVKLTSTANTASPTTVYVNGTATAVSASGVSVPYNSFVKLVSAPADGYLADGFALTSSDTLHYYKQAYCLMDGETKAVNNTPVKNYAEFSAKSGAAITTNTITAEARNAQINAAVAKSGESYNWTATQYAWVTDAVDGSLASSATDQRYYTTTASLAMDVTVPAGLVYKLSFDHSCASYGVGYLIVTKNGVAADPVDLNSDNTADKYLPYTQNLEAGTYHLEFRVKGQLARLKLKNFSITNQSQGAIGYAGEALAPYGTNPDITATAAGWGAWTANQEKAVEGRETTFTFDSSKLPDGYALSSVYIDGVKQTMSGNSFTYTPTQADADNGLLVKAVYVSPYVGIYKDTATNKIYANGWPIRIDGHYVYYLKTDGTARTPADLNSGVKVFEPLSDGDTVYGGGNGVNVASAKVKIASLPGQTTGQVITVYGGGSNADVTGDVTVEADGTGATGNINIYGGCYNGKVGGNVTYQAYSLGNSGMNLYGGGYGGSVAGNITMNVTAAENNGKCGDVYGGGVNCSVGGNIDVTINGISGTTYASINGGAKVDDGKSATAKNISLTVEGSPTVDSINVQGQTAKADDVTLNIPSSSNNPTISGNIIGCNTSAKNVTMTISAASATIGGKLVAVPASCTAQAVTADVSCKVTGDVIGVSSGGTAQDVKLSTGSSVGGSVTGVSYGTAGNVKVNTGDTVTGSVTGVVGTAQNVTVTTNNIGAGVTGISSGSSAWNVTVTTQGTVAGDVIGAASLSKVTGDVIVTTAAANSVLGADQSTNPVTGMVAVTTNGAVTSAVTGTKSRSAGAVQVTTNAAVGGAVTAAGGDVTGNASLTVNSSAGSAYAVKTGSAAITIGGQASLELGAGASLAGTPSSISPVCGSNIYPVRAGGTTLTIRMSAKNNSAVLESRDNYTTVTGTDKCKINIYSNIGKQVWLRDSGTVNLFTTCTSPIYVPKDGSAPVVDSTVMDVSYIKSSTPDLENYDKYSLLDLSAPTVDDTNHVIFGNGFPLRVDNGYVRYTDANGKWVYLRSDVDLSAYTVYGGADTADVASSSISFGPLGAKSPRTYYGGGRTGSVTGSISLTFGWSGFSSTTAVSADGIKIYGGSENADVSASLYVSLDYNETAEADTIHNYISKQLTLFAGCKNGDFTGSAKIDLQKSDRNTDGDAGICRLKLPAAIYLCSETGAFTGNIDLYSGAQSYQTVITGGIQDAYSATGTSSGTNVLHLSTYTDTTKTSITRKNTKTTIDGAGDANYMSTSWDTETGQATISYRITDSNTNAKEYTAMMTTLKNIIVKSGGELWFDNGAVGTEDSADVRLRGFCANASGTFRVGSSTAPLTDTTGLTVTVDGVPGDSKSFNFAAYMAGSLTLNINTSLTSNCSFAAGNASNNTGFPSDVNLVIGRQDGSSETYENLGWLAQAAYTHLTINHPYTATAFGVTYRGSYDEKNITLNLDRSKYRTAQKDGYCVLETITTDSGTPVAGTVAADGTITGNVLIYLGDDNATTYATVDADKDGVLDADEKTGAVTKSGFFAAPDSVVTMLSGSLDALYFYGTTLNQSGGTVRYLSLWPASSTQTYTQGTSAECGHLDLNPYTATAAAHYPLLSNCQTTANLGGTLSNVYDNSYFGISGQDNNDTVNLLGTAQITTTLKVSNIVGKLDFSAYTLKAADTETGKYDDISYAVNSNVIGLPKTSDNSTLYVVTESGMCSYSKTSTGTATPLANPVADFGNVTYGDTSAHTITVNLGAYYRDLTGQYNIINGNDIFMDCAFNTSALTCTLTLKNDLEPGLHTNRIQVFGTGVDGSYSAYYIQVSVNITPQTVTVTPNDNLSAFANSSDSRWKTGYTLDPDVSAKLADADKDLLAVASMAEGSQPITLAKTRSSDNRYTFTLDGTTKNLTLSKYNGVSDPALPIAAAQPTVSATWGTYSLISAPTGYLVSLTENGTYLPAVRWDEASSVLPYSGNVTCYLKDNTADMTSYQLTLAKTVTGMKVCKEGDLATYSGGRVTDITASTAAVSFTAALNNTATGACGLGEIRVLAVTGSTPPDAATILANGTTASGSSGSYTATLTGLTPNTAYTFYAAHLTEAGVEGPVQTLTTGTTTAEIPTISKLPTAAGTYGTALSSLSITGGEVMGANAALTGKWTWTEANADGILPTVNGSSYSARFTPNDTSYEAIDVSITPNMSPRTVTIRHTSITQPTKAYDETTAISMDGAFDQAVLDGVLAYDKISVDAAGVTGNTADAYAGVGKTLTLTGALILTGTNAQSYQLTQPTGLTASITATPQKLTSADTLSVVRGGTIAKDAILATISGAKGVVTLSCSDTYTAPDTAGTDTITATAAAYDANHDGEPEYLASDPCTVSITVTEKDDLSSAITVTGADALSRAYNGSASAFTGTASVTGHNDITLETAWYSGSTKLDSAPVNAGDYKLVFRVPADNANYAGSKSVAFTISPATVTVAPGTAKVSKVYDGTATAGTISGNLLVSGIASTDSGVTVSVQPSGYTSTDVGGQETVSASLTLNGDTNGNYSLSANSMDLPCEITKATLTADGTVTATAAYGTKLSEISITGLTAKLGGTEVPGTWAFTGDTVYSVSGENAPAACTATFTPSSGAGNYQTLTTTITPVITQTSYSGQALALTKTVYTNHAQTGVEADLTELLNAVGGAAITGAALQSASNLVSNVAFSGSKVTFDVASAASANVTAVINVTLSSVNYSNLNATVTVQTVDKTDAGVSLTGTVPTEKTYGNSSFNLTASASGAGTNGNWTWSSSDNSVLSVVGSGASATVTVAGAGSASITASYESDTTVGSKAAAITVNPAQITITADSITAYVGSKKPDLTYTISGLVGGDGLSTNPTLTCDADMTKTGTYTITAKDAAVSNKNYNSTIQYVSGTLTVSDVPVVPVTPDPGTKVTVPVSSDEGSVKVEATVKNGTASVSITDAQIASITSGTDTGTVKIDVSSLKDVTAATVPAKVIAAANSADSSTGVEVTLPTGTVSLDKTALAAVNAKGTDITLSVDKVDNSKLTDSQKEVLGDQADTALVVDVTILASGEKVSAFDGGSLGISVPYTPKAGEDTSKLVVWFLKDDGTVEPKTGSYNTATGRFEFNTEHLSQYVLVSFPFGDVAANSWYYGNVAYAYMNGLFNGTTDTTFAPETAMTRSMLVTVLYRLSGSESVSTAADFTDVPADTWYTDAVAWAAENKLVEGYGSGLFGPEDTVTREQMATILYRYAAFKGYDTSAAADLSGYTDAANISDYAQDALKWAVGSGLIQGNDNMLMPQDGAQRAQVAAILQRFVQNVVK